MQSNFSLPDDMKFGEAQIIAITAYSIMFIIGLVLNILSLHQLVLERKRRRSRNRMNLLLLHLAVADLMVRVFGKLNWFKSSQKIEIFPNKELPTKNFEPFANNTDGFHYIIFLYILHSGVR